MAHGTWNMALWIASLVPSPRREMPSRNAHATLYHATLLDPDEARVRTRLGDERAQKAKVCFAPLRFDVEIEK
jgi:hypothetical protein